MSFRRSKLEQFDLTSRYDVLDMIQTAGGRILTIQTDDGPKTLNVPKWVNVYIWNEDGQIRREAWLPDWLIEKTGLD